MTQRSPQRLALLAITLCVLLAPGCRSSRDETARYGVHMRRGIEAYERADYKRALIAFQKALQFNKDDPSVYLYIGELYDDYLGDKLKAIQYYNEFLKRSKDEELNEQVRDWVAQAEADAAGEPSGADLVVPTDPEAELKEVRSKLAQALMLKNKYRDRVRELEAAGTPRSRPSLLPWLVAALLGGAAVAVLVLARWGWLGLGPAKQPPAEAPAQPVLDENLIVGRYFWVENEFNLGTVAIAHENGKLRVESTSLSTNARSIGYGALENDTLKAELTDESGLSAPTVFRFAPDGMSFTAEWTDDLGPGMAIGVRER